MTYFKAKAAILFLMLATLVPVAAATAPAQAKDPCFFSQTEWNNWKTEKNGNPGWGDSLTHIQNLTGGCQGTWNQTMNEVKYCPEGDTGRPRTFRAWAQSDGDQVWIGFSDYGQTATPRFRAHCQAGIFHPNSNTFTYIAE